VRSLIAMMTSIVLFSTAVGLNGRGSRHERAFCFLLRPSVEAAVLLATIGLAVDLLAVILPTVGVQLLQRHAFLAAGAAWTIWVAALGMTLLAATGFASTNIGDAVAGRAKVAARARRSPIELDGCATIASASRRRVRSRRLKWSCSERSRRRRRSGAPRTAARRDPHHLGARLRESAELREALATAERRDGLDVELRTAEASSRLCPRLRWPIRSHDCGGDSGLVVRRSVQAGARRHLAAARAWAALTPSMAGLLAMMAISLSQARRS